MRRLASGQWRGLRWCGCGARLEGQETLCNFSIHSDESKVPANECLFVEQAAAAMKLPEKFILLDIIHDLFSLLVDATNSLAIENHRTSWAWKDASESQSRDSLENKMWSEVI